MDNMDTYKAKMALVQTPSYLKDRVLDEMRSLSAEQATEQADLLPGKIINFKGKTAKSPDEQRSNRQRVLVPLFSAAVVILIIIIALPLLGGSEAESVAPDDNAQISQTENPFDIQTYISTPDSSPKAYELFPVELPPGYDEPTIADSPEDDKGS